MLERIFILPVWRLVAVHPVHRRFVPNGLIRAVPATIISLTRAPGRGSMTGQRRFEKSGIWLKVSGLPGVVAAMAVLIVPPLAAWAQEAVAERSTAAGVYTDEQAVRGQAIFGQRCRDCHGETLEGGGMAPGLRGAEFMASWQGKPLRRMYSRIISTMPPDDVGSLMESETLALVALVLRANGSPAGSQALVRADELNTIIVAPPAGKR
jgi:mono/diheme cytochrome c family protein